MFETCIRCSAYSQFGELLDQYHSVQRQHAIVTYCKTYTKATVDTQDLMIKLL